MDIIAKTDSNRAIAILHFGWSPTMSPTGYHFALLFVCASEADCIGVSHVLSNLHPLSTISMFPEFYPINPVFKQIVLVKALSTKMLCKIRTVFALVGLSLMFDHVRLAIEKAMLGVSTLDGGDEADYVLVFSRVKKSEKDEKPSGV